MRMRLDYVSDLHMDWYRLQPVHEIPDIGWIAKHQKSSAIVVAGDFSDDCEDAIETLKRLNDRYIDVMWVDGNHDFFRCGASVEDKMEEMREISEQIGVCYLPFKAFTKTTGVSVVGCNGWYDFNFTPHLCPAKDARERWKSGPCRDRENLIFRTTVEDLAKKQARQLRKDIEKGLEHGDRIVVVTHTPPHHYSLNLNGKDLGGNLPGSLGSSALTRVLEKYGNRIHVWIHGHEHGSVSYRICGTRVVSNARGFPWDGAEKCRISTIKIK